MDEAKHVSVLLNECIENLNIKPSGIYLDGTLGMGGHSYQIASRLTTGRLICIDRDETAIERAGKRLAPFADKITLVHGNFCDAAQILDSLNIPEVDGMLFDLGVSSPQLDETWRGFSYMHDAPLDMRMDSEDSLSAYEGVRSLRGIHGRPVLAVPQLRVVIAAHDGDVLHKSRVIAQVLRDECAPLTVQLAARGVREKRAHLPLLDVWHGVDLVGKHLPVLSAVHAEAAIHGKSDEKDLAQLVPELCGDKETPLVVKRMLIFARHGTSPLSVGHCPISHHF